MLRVPLGQRFFATTRGQIVLLARRAPRTIDELCQALGLTRNAIRAHLATLERDGLVRRGGVGRTRRDRRGPRGGRRPHDLRLELPLGGGGGRPSRVVPAHGDTTRGDAGRHDTRALRPARAAAVLLRGGRWGWRTWPTQPAVRAGAELVRRFGLLPVLSRMQRQQPIIG